MRNAVAVIAIVLIVCACAAQPLRTWPLPPGVSAVRVNGYDMAYVEKGTGAPVVLIHGAMNDFRYFSQTMDAFAARYQTIAVSLRHYYPEPWDGKGSTFSVKQHVADVAAFIRERKLGPVHLVGHSRGGTIALYVATLHPELVRSQVFAEGGARMPAFDASLGTD
jgi:esterase